MEFLRTVVAKVLVFILFGVLILSFAVWGIGDIFRDSTGPRTVAKVGQYEISDLAFSRALAQDFNSIQRNLGGSFTMDQAAALGIPQQVLQRLVADGLFSAEAADLGLAVTDDEAREAIFTEPSLQDEFGRFSRDRFQQLLSFTGSSEQEYVEDLKDRIKRRHVIQAVITGIAPPTALAETLFRYRAESRVADYVALPFAVVTVEREPDETELRELHEDYSDRFLAPETRDVTVLTITPESAGGGDVNEEDLRAAYEERLPDLSIPERRTLRQVVLSDEAAADAFQGRLETGVTFAEAVLQETGREAVSLGKLSRSDLSITLPEAVDKVFAVEQGEVAGPVSSAFGQHFIFVEAIEDGSVPPFEAVKDELAKDLRMEAAIDEMIALANSTDDLLAGGATLENAADQLGLPLSTVENMDQDGNDPDGNPIEGLPSPERFLSTAFSTPEGDQSLLTETEQGGYFLVRVDAVQPPAVRPFEDVRGEVESVWRELERETLALETAQDIADRINHSNVTLAGIAEGAGYELQRGVKITRVEAGLLQPVAGQLFEAAPGEAVIGQAADAAIVAVMTKAEQADPGANSAQVAALQRDLVSALQNDLLAMYGNQLQDHLGVTVNQGLVDQVVEGY